MNAFNSFSKLSKFNMKTSIFFSLVILNNLSMFSEISKLKQNLIIKKIDQSTVNISINDNEMLLAYYGQ